MKVSVSLRLLHFELDSGGDALRRGWLPIPGQQFGQAASTSPYTASSSSASRNQNQSQRLDAIYRNASARYRRHKQRSVEPSVNRSQFSDCVEPQDILLRYSCLTGDSREPCNHHATPTSGASALRMRASQLKLWPRPPLNAKWSSLLPLTSGWPTMPRTRPGGGQRVHRTKGHASEPTRRSVSRKLAVYETEAGHERAFGKAWLKKRSNGRKRNKATRAINGNRLLRQAAPRPPSMGALWPLRRHHQNAHPSEV
jgi:hypothetical protein